MLSTGDTFTNGRYPNIDFANGGNIKGMIAAADAYLKLTNAKSRIVPGHGPVADKAALTEYRAMLVTARDRMATAGEGRQERGRRGGGKAVRRSRRQMGADRTCQPRTSSAWSGIRWPTSREKKPLLKRILKRS